MLTAEQLIGGIILAGKVSGLRVIGNTFTGITAEQIVLHGEAKEKRDNRVTDSPPTETKSFAESLLQWQRAQRVAD